MAFEDKFDDHAMAVNSGFNVETNFCFVAGWYRDGVIKEVIKQKNLKHRYKCEPLMCKKWGAQHPQKPTKISTLSE